MAYNNQKRITIRKDDPISPYAITSHKHMMCAMEMLTGNAYKMWHYLQSNQNGYSFLMRSEDVCRFCSFSRSSYDRAVKELIQAGYLVKTSGDNEYIFQEVIQKNKKD